MKKGNKIILSEAQFKQIMRSKLNETQENDPGKKYWDRYKSEYMNNYENSFVCQWEDYMGDPETDKSVSSLVWVANNLINRNIIPCQEDIEEIDNTIYKKISIDNEAVKKWDNIKRELAQKQKEEEMSKAWEEHDNMQ